MKKIFESATVLLFLLCIAGVVHATPIPIVNASFEDDPTSSVSSNNTGSWYYSATGWVITNDTNTGTYRPSDTFSSIPDGDQIAFTNGPTFYQILTTTLSPNTLYTLSAYVGWRNDSSATNFPGYTMELWAGNDQLKSISSPAPERGGWVLTTLTYTSTDEVTTDQFLKIQVDNLGTRQINFDMFSLTATPLFSSPVPEPSTMLLFGLGLLGVAGVGRRKN